MNEYSEVVSKIMSNPDSFFPSDVSIDWVGERIEFYDEATKRPMMCVKDYHGNGPWLFYKTLNDWVTYRRPTERDLISLGVLHWSKL